MREIKFRGWDGNRFHYSEHFDCIQFPTGFEELAFIDLGHDYNHDKYLNDIQQYTGLKDKNGKEIYEGDILKDTNPTGSLYEVLWYNEDARFEFKAHRREATILIPKPKVLTSSTSTSKDVVGELLEVIGNIYENPELLEEK